MGQLDIDEDLLLAIDDLVDEGHLQEASPAYGVAQRVVHFGYESLSNKQRFVYDRDVVPMLVERAKEIKVIEKMNSNPE